jgi:topoisomerase-4 subunit B
MQKLGKNPEITRFKGLGEISPNEFGQFIGLDIRLQPVLLEMGDHIQKLLEYYMGKNTQQRQEFIIENLRVDLDKLEVLN